LRERKRVGGHREPAPEAGQEAEVLADRYPGFGEFGEFGEFGDKLDPTRVFANDYLDRVLGR
jgi:hypothetical protein